MLDRLPPIPRTAGRIAATLGAAILVSGLVTRTGLQPASILTPTAAATVVVLLFAFRPAEGLGAFLLFSLVANTIQLLPADLWYFDEIGLVLLLAVSLIRYRVPGARLRFGVAEWALAVAVIAGVASSLVSGVPTSIWVVGLLLMVKGVIFFYLVSWLPLRIGDILAVGSVIVGAVILIVLLAAWELVDQSGFQHALGLPAFSQNRGGLPVLESVFLHPALFGWVTVFASLYVYAWVLVRRTWWLLPLGLVLNVATFFSGRRTPILGLLLALVVALAWVAWRARSKQTAIRRWVPMSVAVILLIAAFLPAVGGFYADTPRTYLDGSQAITEIFSHKPDPEAMARVAPRVALYAGSVAIAIDDFPLGAGLGRFGSYMSRLHYSPVYVEYGLNAVPGLSPENRSAIDDSFWPSVLGETGVIGFAAFAVFLVTVGLRLWNVVPTGIAPAWEFLGLGALLVFVQGLVASLTAGTYVAPPIAYFVFAAAGSILAASGHMVSRADGPATGSGKGQPGGSIALGGEP